MKSILTVLALSSVLAFAPYAYAQDDNSNGPSNGPGNLPILNAPNVPTPNGNVPGGNNVSVPEPSTMLLLGAAVAGLAARKLRKKSE